MKKFSKFMLLARKIIPAMLCGGQWFDEIGHAYGFEFNAAAGKFNRKRLKAVTPNTGPL
jgi:hypothetical protein